MSSKVYPSPEVANFDNSLDERLDTIRGEVAQKYGIPAEMVEAITSEFMEEAINHIFQPWLFASYHTGSNFPAVDPAHFRKIENTRLGAFCEHVLADRGAGMVEHEVGLMLQEIRDLRNVLKLQFQYDWSQHRQAFPLIAQWSY